MSVASSVKSALGIQTDPISTHPAAKLAPQIAARLTEAKVKLADLMRQHGELALAVETGDAGADTKMAEWRGRVAQQEQTILDLEAAWNVASVKDQEAEAQSIARKKEAMVRSVTQKAAYAQKAVVKLQAAIENLEIAFREVVKLGDDARTTAENAGLQWPAWSALGHFDRWKMMVELELYRVGAGPVDHNGVTHRRALPGILGEQARLQLKIEGSRPDLANVNRPSEVEPIADFMARERDHIVAIVKGEEILPEHLHYRKAPTEPPAELFVGTAPLAPSPHREQPAPAASPTIANTEAPDAPEPIPANVYTGADMEMVLTGFRMTAGRDAVAGVLKQFGSPDGTLSNLPELTQTKWGAVMTACNELPPAQVAS